jgi:type III secretory pathway component EscT
MRAHAITQRVPNSPQNSPEWVLLVLAELGRAGIDPRAWLLGAARCLPSVILVPAFGLRALPLPAQLLFAFVLAGAALPGIAGNAVADLPWLYALVAEAARGLPLALSAAATVWGASMAGNLVDELRGGAQPAEFPGVDSPSGPLGILLSLAASVAFLELGGPARLAEALAAAPPLASATFGSVARSLVAGVQLAVLIAAPLLVVALFIEVFRAVLSRATNAALWAALFAPLRALSLLAILALLLDRLLEGVALYLRSSLAF